MSSINQLSPVLVNDLTHINNILPLSEKDNDCLEEIKQVLQKFGCETRFGIALLHKHFDLSPDELLVEFCDVENRVLTAKPQKKQELNNEKLIETVWRFDGFSGKSCQRFCPRGMDGKHYGYPDHY